MIDSVDRAVKERAHANAAPLERVDGVARPPLSGEGEESRRLAEGVLPRCDSFINQRLSLLLRRARAQALGVHKEISRAIAGSHGQSRTITGNHGLSRALTSNHGAGLNEGLGRA